MVSELTDLNSSKVWPVLAPISIKTPFLIVNNLDIKSGNHISENKIINIHLISDTDSGGTIIEDFRPGYLIKEKYFIPVMNFNDVQKTLNLTDVSVIKIDVEGSELKVISSLENIISEFKPVIICEVLWAHNEEKLEYNRKKNIKILEKIKSLEYKVFRLIKSGKNDKILSLEHIEEIENYVYTLENRELCDYIMIHKDVEKKVKNIFNFKQSPIPIKAL